MSELPSGWVKIALGDAIHIQKGKKPFGLGPKSEDRTIPYINISAFETKSVKEYAPWQDVPRCEPPDTLLVWDGARAGLSGRGVGGFIGSTLARLTSDLAEPAYLFYFIHSNYGYLNTHTKGVGIPHIDPVVLAEISFPLPPASEQTRIVAKLEELLSELDAGVAELKAAQKKLAKYRQSLLKAAVEGALTAEWRARHIPTETGAQLLQRILTERRSRWEARQLSKFAEQGKAPPKDWQKKYPEPVQPDTTDLPELPDGWVWATVNQLAQVGTGVTPLRSKNAYFNEGTVPWVTSGALNSETVTSAIEFVTEFALRECRLEVYPPGSLLVAMYGEGKTRGKCSELLIPATINQAIAAIVLEPAAQPSKAYLKAFLLHSYERMRAQASGGVQPNLNLQIVKAIALPLPPHAEQAEIMHLLDAQFDQISQQLAAVERGIKQSSAQRQNILRAAFAGQLVPQDPNDEPASTLLECIRIKRATREKASKHSRKKEGNSHMKKNTTEILREWIKTRTNDWFTFEEISEAIPSDYDALKDAIFTLLSQPNPIIEQFFEHKEKCIAFRRSDL